MIRLTESAQVADSLDSAGKRRINLLATTLFLLIQAACSGESLSRPAAPLPTPPPADGFDFPLDPNRYGPYVRGVSGPLDVDTRFGVQNPALGDAPKCFHDRDGAGVPFRELYHAGEDWFRLDAAGQVDSFSAAGDPVHAVAQGIVYLTQEIGPQGWIVVLAHQLADGAPFDEAHGEPVYSAYWHVTELQVERGDAVERGQVIALIRDQGGNSHLHWEMRAFADASDLFPPDSAGGRGTCNGRTVGVAYTWDDDPTRARPEYWGYFDPVAFVESHRP
jgi:murein DD-endopeptidase MepM/ murein hydrolase activator NlpD